jgi:hypothetical protein
MAGEGRSRRMCPTNRQREHYGQGITLKNTDIYGTSSKECLQKEQGKMEQRSHEED